MEANGKGGGGVSAIQIEARAAQVLRALQGAGYPAYAVGGCVRDSLLGRTPSDWDVCTGARPQQVIAVFGDARCIPTGLRHGTVTVRSGGALIEVTTFRTEGAYSDGRHPDRVDFIGDVRGDLARRDFTVNAMAYNDDEGLIDPFGGQEDLRQGVLRAVGEPGERFDEDALRILRLFRFGAKLGFALDGSTRDAALARCESLSRVSAERIRDELTKLLCCAGPSAYLPRPLLKVCLPEAAAGGERAFAFRLRALDATPPEAEVRLAALLGACDGDETCDANAAAQTAREAMRRLRFSNAQTDAVTLLVRERALTPEGEPRALRIQARRCLARMTLTDLMRLKNLRDARLAAGLPGRELSALLAQAEELRRGGACCSLAQLAVGGRELAQELGVRGPQIGKLLALLLERVICEQTPNERKALLREAKAALQELPKP